MYGASRHGSANPDPAGQGLDFAVGHGKVAWGSASSGRVCSGLAGVFRFGLAGRDFVW